MARSVILIGTILILGSRLADTISPQCRCQNLTAKSRRFHRISTNCELIPTKKTEEKFSELIKREKIFIELHIKFTASNCDKQISNSYDNCSHIDEKIKNVLFPYIWTWVYEGQNGMYPVMKYPYDYNIHSLWTLDRAKVVLDAVLLIPDNCMVTIGELSLLKRVFQSLNKMAAKKMKPNWRGYFCHDIDNSKSFSSFSLLMHHYLGFVRGLTVKHCCPLKKERGIEPDDDIIETDGDQMKNISGPEYGICDGIKVPTTMLMDLTTVLGSIWFMILPFILCYFMKEDLLFDALSPDSNHEWINTNEGIFSFQHFLIWITWWDSPSLIASRIRRVLFVVLLPIIVLYHIMAEYYYMPEIQREYLRRHIPLGSKSIVYGFRENYDNTLGFLGGTYIWGAIYFISTSILICLPVNLGEAIISKMIPRVVAPFTFLLLDAPRLKKYSSIDVSGYKSYQLAYITLKANFQMVLNRRFWIAIFVKWKAKIERCWSKNYECIPIIFLCVMSNMCMTFIYIFLYFIETIACLCYYVCPMVYMFFSINVNLYEKIGAFWFDDMPKRCIRVPMLAFWFIFFFTIIVTSIILLYIFLLVFYICLCSFFIFNLTIIFTLVGIIITPEIIGYVGYVLSAMFYIKVIYQRFTAKYEGLMELIAKTPSIYVVRNKNIQYIRQDIFYSVVEHIRPLRSEIFLLLSKYFFLFLYLSMSYNIIKQYQLSLQYTEKILSCLLITQLPNMVINVLHQLMNSYQDEYNEKKEVKKLLKKFGNYVMRPA